MCEVRVQVRVQVRVRDACAGMGGGTAADPMAARSSQGPSLGSLLTGAGVLSSGLPDDGGGAPRGEPLPGPSGRTVGIQPCTDRTAARISGPQHSGEPGVGVGLLNISSLTMV